MRLLFIFCLALNVNLFAQNQRYVYEYKLVKDSTNKANQRTEMMYLDTTKEGSEYYSYTAYHSDSLVRAALETELKATGMVNIKPDMKVDAERYSVSKTYPDFKTGLHNRIGMNRYKIADERKLTWKILPDK